MSVVYFGWREKRDQLGKNLPKNKPRLNEGNIWIRLGGRCGHRGDDAIIKAKDR